MSMHLSKIRVIEKSSSKKWKSAEAKHQAAELEKSWNEIKQKHSTQTGSNGTKPNAKIPQLNKGCGHLLAGFTPPRGPNAKIPSRPDSVAVAAKPESKVYTGDNVMGISIVHKSCLQPVFSEEQAKDFANMRR